MFGLFKKKEEKPRNAGNERFKELSAQFQPEELTVLAVTGANGFANGSDGEGDLWTATIGLTAWMEEDSPEIHQGSSTLTAAGDEQLLEILRRQTPRDFIIKFRARVSEDGERLLLLGLPEPGFDPDLKAILEEQKKPVTFWEEGLGTFTLNRQVDWFETEVDWLGTEISLTFDREEDRAACAANAKALLSAAADWDRRVRDHTSAEPLELDSIEIRADGSFTFWFSDGDMGQSIRVSGDMENGPTDASTED